MAAPAHFPEGNFDTQQSTLGPLPTFNKPARDPDTMSVASSDVGSEFSVASGLLPQPSDSVPEKAEIKRFVKELVKGKKYTVVTTEGDLRACTVALSKKLNSMKIQAGDQSRKIPLTSVADVHVGREPADIKTPLGDLDATLALTNGECITFRFDSAKVRDTFAMCIQLFSQNQR